MQGRIEELGNEIESQDLSEEMRKFVPSKKVQELRIRLIKFMEDHVYPMENEFYKLAQSTMRWTVHPEEENLKELAKKEGLWNLWIPVCVVSGSHLSYLIYSMFFLSCLVAKFKQMISEDVVILCGTKYLLMNTFDCVMVIAV